MSISLGTSPRLSLSSSARAYMAREACGLALLAGPPPRHSRSTQPGRWASPWLHCIDHEHRGSDPGYSRRVIGIDVLEIARLEEALARRPNLLSRLFTEDERAYADGHARPAVHLAARFC